MKDHVITLPKFIDDGRIDNILELLNLVRTKDSSFILDFTEVKEISAAGLVILNCISDSIIEHKRKVGVKNLSLSSSLNNHIKNLFNYQSNQMLSMTQMAYEDKNNIVWGAINSLDPSFPDRIDNKFQNILSEDQLWYVRLIINELMQNSLDHSTAERYFFYAGIKNNDFIFGVCDMGVSIPAKLEQKYICEDDKAYLLKSLELGVGTRRIRCGGLGLNHMFEILKQQKGRLVIVSRYAQIRKYFARRKTEANFLKKPLRGTWCMARIPISQG
ncbi:MAG: hypothetical protein A2381_06230 [Bdellovibrionales bacterium RIFOXYB1_FULL_37_110]|nr:MAG: hypothetical protein A2417_02505 [Bdellovibrionales bacterium RIFOXYC1_FULL_37_79]OFZ60102.1 MAG: hypothetical protein A2381_06230 [Bdellovibrionales bacterium RIFOXYB1_FULL_37_110]OFZ63435.1 MAG: hypothetical protein A2577_00055 [Bdellovibrionales bacterium RIFOXYD1_FULL_36_51]